MGRAALASLALLTSAFAMTAQAQSSEIISTAGPTTAEKTRQTQILIKPAHSIGHAWMRSAAQGWVAQAWWIAVFQIRLAFGLH